MDAAPQDYIIASTTHTVDVLSSCSTTWAHSIYWSWGSGDVVRLLKQKSRLAKHGGQVGVGVLGLLRKIGS
jgi:hypothetical protein